MRSELHVSRGAVAFAAAVSLCACARGLQDDASTASFVPFGEAATGARVVAPGASRHLYVYDSWADRVLEYSLAGGIPRRRPSNVLWIETAEETEDIAVGADGSIYADHYVIAKNAYAVDVYAPGASGDDPPVRSLDVRRVCCALAVDPNGYLFVAGYTDVGSMAAVYAPGAKGNDRPIQTFGVQGTDEFPFDAALDRAGNLYITTANRPSHVDVYGYPIIHPHFLRTFCSRRPAYWMALDAEQIAYLGEGRYTTDRPSIPAVEASHATCPADPLRRIAARGYDVDVYAGLAVLGTHLFAANERYEGPGWVFTFDTRHGRQEPLDVLPIDGNPVWVRVGP